MTIELVVLDVNETLFPLDPVAARMADVGLDGHLELWFARVLRDGLAAAAAGRFVTFVDLARDHLLALLGGDHPPADRGEAVTHVLGGFGEVRPHSDVEPGLRSLHQAGLTVVALTNGSAGLTRSFLERSGLDRFVAAVHDVSEAGAWKPAAAPYRHVLGHHGVDAADAVMVAVHPWDVFGAQNAGLVGAWIDRDAGRYPEAFGRPDLQASDLPGIATAIVAHGHEG